MITNEVGLKKLQRYCTYQERCHFEVRTKLLNLKIYGEELEEIISELIKDDYLNEQRYAEAFASGKFRINKWGKQKIIQRLKAKRVSDYCITKGLSKIDEDDYKKSLSDLIEKFYAERASKKFTDIDLLKKCFKFCQNKGYEYPLITEALEVRH